MWFNVGMKKFLQVLFLLAIYVFIFLGLYNGYKKISLRDVYSFIGKPCAVPVTYKIGTFDKRFGISREEFLKDINQSINIWEKPIGEKLFEYSDNGNLTINLIFDQRQEDTIKNNGLNKILNQTKSVANSTNQEIASAKANYENKKVEYLKLVSEFEIKGKNYEEQVSYWNTKGGAPSGEYNKLQIEKANLLTLQNEAEASRLEINNLADGLNVLIEKYNSIASSANSAISDYNSEGHIVGEFREGEYISDPKGERINIYEFSDKTKLIRVLSHEFGHALNIEHNDNPKSIMYKLNQGENKALSKEDLQALKTVCGI